jgi:hypothetical protein
MLFDPAFEHDTEEDDEQVTVITSAAAGANDSDFVNSGIEIHKAVKAGFVPGATVIRKKDSWKVFERDRWGIVTGHSTSDGPRIIVVNWLARQGDTLLDLRTLQSLASLCLVNESPDKDRLASIRNAL